jgi:polar amino acid transport system substrate-binding protein
MLLAACGSSATPTKSVLAQVIERGTLRVAVIVPNPTFAEPDASGNLIGYEADIANLLGQSLGVKVEFIQTDAPGRVTLVQTGKADVAIATFTRNLERMKVINFTDPLFLESVVLITTPDKTDLNKISDFNKAGLKIAILTGGTQVEAVKSLLPNAEGVAFPGLDDLVQALLSGQVDAATTGNVGVGPLMKAHPGQLKPVEGNLSPPQDDGIGVVQGDFAWWNYVNTFVHQIHADGTTYTLWQKYLGEGSPGPFSIPPTGTT